MIGVYIIPRKDGNVQRQRMLAIKRAAIAGFGRDEIRLYVEERNGRELANMTKDAKAHELSAVIVYSLELFGASMSSIVTNVEQIAATGTRLIVIEGDVDVSPLGDAIRLCRALIKAKRKSDWDTRSRAQKNATGRPRTVPAGIAVEAVRQHGNVSAAARAVGVSRSSLRRAYLEGVADGRVA
jgi:DNA invertase Pin-like site-specific DNA recombinase